MEPEDLFDTHGLVRNARDGDARAIELLYRRYIDRVETWARGRVPLRARDLHDTQSVAHDVLVRSLLGVVDGDEGIRTSFRAYVRRALRNRLADLGRGTRPLHAELDADLPENAPSELECLLEREFEAFVRCRIDELPGASRELLVLRFELELGYAELARRLSLESADAARMRVNRVLTQLRTAIDRSA